MQTALPPKKIAIVGGGPAGLMAAQTLAGQGLDVHVFERKASVGRKFLIAGRGGLNLTHSEPMPAFARRYRGRQAQIEPWLQAMDNQALRDWASDLGISTYVGSSGRVFPTDMKAAPLLRAWLKRLREAGVQFHVNHRCLGVSHELTLRFESENAETAFSADAVILAMGGASWPQLGSDGAWLPWLTDRGLDVAPLQPANCGFVCSWSDFFRSKFAGAALKPLRIRLAGDTEQGLQGECIVSEYGMEGSLIYTLSANIRDRIAKEGRCTIELDLLPDHSHDRIRSAVLKPRNGRSLSDFLRRHFKLTGVKAALIYEIASKAQRDDAETLTGLLKALPVTLTAARPIAEAISTAGGVALEALDAHLMWKDYPGVFFAGEMLDWEAPTGGYLLTASMASGRVAAQGAHRFLGQG